MIIHFNGMGGVGKFTVAKLMAAKMNARLIDNHSLIDAVMTCCDRGTADYFSMLKDMIAAVLSQIARQPQEIYIFTNCLAAEFEEDRDRLDSLKIFAKNKNMPFVQILLECDIQENKNRVIAEDRMAKGKLHDANTLDDLYKNYTIYHPPADFALRLDTTTMSPENVVESLHASITAMVPQ